jgi:hypothetical protein
MSPWQQLAAHFDQHAPVYLLTALVMIAALAASTAFLWLRLRTMGRPFAQVAAQTEDPGALLQAVLQTAERTETKIGRLDRKLNDYIDDSKTFLRRMGIVRYDAFDDISGLQSFSLCILNGEGDGILITYLTGKKSTRSYAVTIEKGRASRELSDEERRALGEALSSDAVAAQA